MDPLTLLLGGGAAYLLLRKKAAPAATAPPAVSIEPEFVNPGAPSYVSQIVGGHAFMPPIVPRAAETTVEVGGQRVKILPTSMAGFGEKMTPTWEPSTISRAFFPEEATPPLLPVGTPEPQAAASPGVPTWAYYLAGALVLAPLLLGRKRR